MAFCEKVRTTLGENGMAEKVNTGNSLLDYFDKCCRDLEPEKHRIFIKCIIDETKLENNPNKIFELFVMMLQVRDCRGGKGDKLPFYNMMQIMFEYFPITVVSIVKDIPYYGYWKDLLLVIKHVTNNPIQGIDYLLLKNKCYSVMANQLLKDYDKLKNGDTQITFVGKFAPRKGKEFDRKLNAVSNLVKIMFPDLVGSCLNGKSKEKKTIAWNSAFANYRKIVSALSTALNVPEQHMCSGRWQEIDFAQNVTSLCLNRNMNSFLNQTKSGEVKYPENQDRILCAEHVIENLSNLPGKVLSPHELIKSIIYNKKLTTNSEAVIESQWRKIRENVIEQTMSFAPDTNFKLSSLVPIADVSGSMLGTPIEVCIALSILLSEITHENFRNLILTFSSDCRCEDFSQCPNIVEKVKKLRTMHWGMSTNFVLAMQRIAKIVEDNGLTTEETPDLCVFSDMQFDSACVEYNCSDKWSTMYEKIIIIFNNLGMRMDGTPRPAPKIVFWNLRSDTIGYPVEATQSGVVTMSGYNPSLMKYFLSGQLDGVDEEIIDKETGLVNKTSREITPLDNFKNIISDPRYIPIWDKVSQSPEINNKYG